MISAKDVQSLREKTGCGMMDCKTALTQTNGDMEKAIDFLREKGLATVAKKSGRIATEGLVDCFVKDNIGVIIEINSETDFVAINADFQSFVKGCANTVIETNPSDVNDLLEKNYTGTDKKVTDVLRDLIVKIGENINIRRFVRIDGDVVAYLHGAGRIGVLIKFDTEGGIANKTEFAEFGKDICMQIAAMNPHYLNSESVPAETVEEEKRILHAQIKNDENNANKPDAIIEKMVGGKIKKFFENECLLEQQYVKDMNLTVAKYVEEKAKELGGKIAINMFVRFEKGEGLQKKDEDFAAEVEKMIK